MRNKVIIIVVGFLLVGGGSFYGGMYYGKQSVSKGAVNGNGQGRMQQFGLGGAARGARTNGGVTAGEILAKDASSITVKLQDGGSKIVFLSDTTSVTKTVKGTADDLIIGEQVTVSGDANTDGSINAQSIQVRPQGMNRVQRVPIPGAVTP